MLDALQQAFSHKEAVRFRVGWLSTLLARLHELFSEVIRVANTSFFHSNIYTINMGFWGFGLLPLE